MPAGFVPGFCPVVFAASSLPRVVLVAYDVRVRDDAGGLFAVFSMQDNGADAVDAFEFRRMGVLWSAGVGAQQNVSMPPKAYTIPGDNVPHTLSLTLFSSAGFTIEAPGSVVALYTYEGAFRALTEP